MISGFQSRTFGLGLGDLLNAEMQNRINVSRRSKKYKSELDAEIVNSNSNKNDLTDDPLLRYFKVGVNNQGYWTSCHAKLQLEDVVDCLTHIYPDFDFLFLYDQSSGHTKMREDSLIASNMNVSYGGGG